MHSTSSLDSIRNTIKAVDKKIEPLNEYIAVKEIQACSLMARYFTPAVAKTSSMILGDGFVNLEKAVDAIPGAKPTVMAVSRRCPSLEPVYKVLAGKLSYNNALKPKLFDAGVVAPSSFRTIQDNAVSLVLLSMLVYEDEANVKAKIPDWSVGYFEHKELDTEGYVLQKGNIAVIAFRGTEALNSRDWSTDFGFALAPLTKKREDLVQITPLQTNVELPHSIVHSGFQIALNSVKQQIVDQMTSIKNQGNPNIELYVTGHSLGGALADLCVAQMLAETSDETSQWMKRCFKGLYTYGQPRVGNEEYCQLSKEIDNKMFRFVLAHDIVPRMPLLDTYPSNYVHHGTLIYMQPNGKADIISNPCGTHDHEQVHLLLGWFDQTVKTVQNWKKDSLFRKIVRFTLPYSLNDHLPSDYVEAVMAVDEQPLKRNVFEEPTKKQTEISQ